MVARTAPVGRNTSSWRDGLSAATGIIIKRIHPSLAVRSWTRSPRAGLAAASGATQALGRWCQGHVGKVRAVTVWTTHRNRLRVAIAELDLAKRELSRQAELLSAVAACSTRQPSPSDRHCVNRSGALTQISHDLRTPLNAVIGFSDVMNRELFGPLGHERYRDYASHIRDSGHQLLKAAEDILALTRISANTDPRPEEHCDLDALFLDIWADVKRDVEKRGIRFEQPLPTSQALHTDRRALRQALVNMVIEAALFAPSDGVIFLSACSLDSITTITIAANGAKEPKARSRAFEQAPAHGAGLSLGLAVCASLIGLLGGQFDVRVQPGRGLTARCRFFVHSQERSA